MFPPSFKWWVLDSNPMFFLWHNKIHKWVNYSFLNLIQKILAGRLLWQFNRYFWVFPSLKCPLNVLSTVVPSVRSSVSGLGVNLEKWKKKKKKPVKHHIKYSNSCSFINPPQFWEDAICQCQPLILLIKNKKHLPYFI